MSSRSAVAGGTIVREGVVEAPPMLSEQVHYCGVCGGQLYTVCIILMAQSLTQRGLCMWKVACMMRVWL